MGSTSFVPQQKTSRAVFISVLKRVEIYGNDFLVECKKLFYPNNVSETMWYAYAAAWAASMAFFIRTAEMAEMLSRYLKLN